jgi:hypothetical protein
MQKHDPMRCEKFDTEILKVSVAMGGTITN